MLFTYKAIDQNNESREGTVEATTVDAAITAVQKRGYTVTSIDPVEEESNLLNLEITWFQNISTKEVVILSRQIATLFEAKVSPLRIFQLLAAESDNPQLKNVLQSISEELQAGSSISRAFSSHPDVFSSFYVNLVRAGEESGSLEQSFIYLADYLDRNYQTLIKARNALIYPAFVIGVFVIVMALMLTLVIPRIAKILTDSGQELPIYTKAVIGLSNFMVDYIGFILFILAGIGTFLWWFVQTPIGHRTKDELLLTMPFFGDLNQKLYLTRLCDNMATMLANGVPIVQAIEISADVIDNQVYKEIMQSALVEVKGGRSFAETIAEYPEVPGIFSQMAKVGEESGNLPSILKTLSSFYHREFDNAVDTLIDLIEPIMIVILGLGVGLLLTSVLMPIYNLTSTI